MNEQEFPEADSVWRWRGNDAYRVVSVDLAKRTVSFEHVGGPGTMRIGLETWQREMARG